MGGRDKVFSEAEKAFNEGDGQFAAELTQMLVKINHDDWDARYLKAASLRQRGYEEINTIARAWYLKGALELEGNIKPGLMVKARVNALRSYMTGPQIITSIRYLLNAEKAGDKRISLGIEFTDSGEQFLVELRNSILEVKKLAIPSGMPSVKVTTAQFRLLMAGEEQEIVGDIAPLVELIGLLDLEQESFSLHVR